MNHWSTLGEPAGHSGEASCTARRWRKTNAAGLAADFSMDDNGWLLWVLAPVYNEGHIKASI